MRPIPLTLALLACAAALADAPSNCRLYLAGQYDWGGKTGFYLDMEGGKLDSLPLILAVGDGTDWRITSFVPHFVPDREYHAGLILKDGRAQILLDGQPVADMPAAWKSLTTGLTVNDKPGWANDPGDWIGIIGKVSASVARDGKEAAHQDFDFAEMAKRPPGLLFFEPGQPTSAPLDTRPGDTLTVDVTLKFVSSDYKRYAPYIDRYGQCRYADYPGKVKSDEDFTRQVADEAAQLAKLPLSRDFDEYGGYLKSPWQERATGYFRTLRRDGRWWLITPKGNPCFHVGVCGGSMPIWELTPVTGREYLYESLPPKTAPYDRAWQTNCWGQTDGTEYVSFKAANLLRKYGAAGWDTKPEQDYLRRTRALGFGGGKWGSPRDTVETPVLGHWEVPSLAGHPDVFDPAICARLREALAKQITPRRNDPWVLGWSVGNEYDEIVKRGEVKDILAKPAPTPARRALTDYALKELYGGSADRLTASWKVAAGGDIYAAKVTPPDTDIEKLRCFYEDRYYQTLYDTIKAIDPNHLYLGNWIVPSWWESEEDWRIHARHLDVIGYDRYAPKYADDYLLKLQAQTDKPTLCGEFSFPAWYGGARGFGRYGTYAKDEAETGEMYSQWVRDAAHNPHCVGLIWFMYRDQPLTGRGPGRGDALVYGEHYAFGLVTETDRVKWDMVTRMREANFRAARWRLQGTR